MWVPPHGRPECSGLGQEEMVDVDEEVEAWEAQIHELKRPAF